MQHLTIKARDVQVGDELYNSLATHPAFRWTRVKNVQRCMVPCELDDGRTVDLPGVWIDTFAWSTMEILNAAIAVRRTEPCCIP